MFNHSETVLCKCLKSYWLDTSIKIGLQIFKISSVSVKAIHLSEAVEQNVI